MDIDGRLDEAEEFLPIMEYRLQAQLAFFKALPRFTELETRDKYALLKGRHWRIQGGAREAPGGPNSLIFMQFSAKKL